MPTFELQHTQLPGFAKTWPDEVARIISERLESEIDAGDVRTIVLSIVRGTQRVGVWLKLEWDNYPDAEDTASAVGFLSLAPWLDQVDAVSRGELKLAAPTGWAPHVPLHFEGPEKDGAFKACWLELHRALTATAIEVGTQQLATRFRQPVGLFVSMSGTEARLVAFCDPVGGPLWPLQELRREHGFSSVYPQASLGPAGITIFYPKGEGSDEGGAPCIRRRPLASIERATVDDDELHLHFEGEPFPIRFSAGHTKEEMGGPDRKDVTAALRDCVSAAGKLSTGEVRVELPRSPEAFVAALEAQGEEEDGWLKQLIATHGAQAVSALINGVHLGEKRLAELHQKMASLASDVEAWALVVEHFRHVAGEERADWGWMETRALVALGRWDEVLAPQRVVEDQPGKKKEKKPSPEKALALFTRGDEAAARAELDDSTDGDVLAVRALIEVERSPEAARSLITRALADGIRAHLELHVKAHPVLGQVLREHEAFEASLVASRAAVAALTPSTLDITQQASLTAAPARSLFAAAFSEEGDGKFRVALRRAEGWLAVESDTRVVELRPGQVPVVLWEGEGIEAVVEVPGGLVVTTQRALVLLDARGVPQAELLSPLRFQDPLVAHGSLVACGFGDTLRLARVEGGTVTWCGAIKVNERQHVHSIGFTSATQLLAASSDGLVLIDTSDVMHPRATARVEGQFEILDTWAGHALLKRDSGAQLLDVTAMKGLWHLALGHSPSVAQSTDGRVALAWRGEVVLVDPKTLATERCLLQGSDGSALDDTLAVRVEPNRVVAFTKQEGLMSLEPVALDVGALEQEIAASLLKVRGWADEHFAKWLDGGVPVPGGEEEEDAEDSVAETEPFGGALGRWVGPVASLYPQGPRSVVNTSSDGCVELRFERKDAPRAKRGENEDDRAKAARRLAETVQHTRELLARTLREEALRSILRETAAKVAGRAPVRDFVLGLSCDGLTILDVLTGGGATPPFREVVKPPPARSLRQQMGRNWYRSVDAWTQRARRDAAFRAEVLELLAEGELEAADRVASGLLDVDLEGCAQAWLAAAEVDLPFALDGLLLLAGRGHAEGTARLLTLIDDEDTDLSLPARRVLGRLDEDAAIDLVRGCLEGLEDDGDDQVPTRTLAALSDARLVQLKDALLAAKEVLARPDALLVPLVRAGWVPDAKTLQEGHQLRLQDDDFMGDLFGDEEPDPTATAVRLHLARQVAENAGREGPLWPVDAPVEKSKLGTQRFLSVAWPLWERSGALARVFEVAPARAAKSLPAEGQKYGPDAWLALQVLHQALLRGHEGAGALATALEVASLPADARAQAMQLARASRLQFGWALSKQARFAEARKVADAAVADAPDDGQTLFFEARLCWLEKNDPRAAMPRIEAGLLRATDGVGRSRLLNLYGAAYDALHEVPKALEWFHKALLISDAQGVDHDTGQKRGDAAMTHAILSNIAESHWKLGQPVEARQFAEQASRRGSTTDIVKTILAEAKA